MASARHITVSETSRPILSRHAKLKFDETRKVWVILAPERVLVFCDEDAPTADPAAALKTDYEIIVVNDGTYSEAVNVTKALTMNVQGDPADADSAVVFGSLASTNETMSSIDHSLSVIPAAIAGVSLCAL